MLLISLWFWGQSRDYAISPEIESTIRELLPWNEVSIMRRT